MSTKKKLKALTKVKFKYNETITFVPKDIEKRFKILALLSIELGVWESEMEELAYAFDTGNCQAIEVLNFYEDKMIEIMEQIS